MLAVSPHFQLPCLDCILLPPPHLDAVRFKKELACFQPRQQCVRISLVVVNSHVQLEVEREKKPARSLLIEDENRTWMRSYKKERPQCREEKIPSQHPQPALGRYVK